VIYDPEQLLDKRMLRGFELQGMEYRPLAEPFWLPGVELGLRLWQGRFEDYENAWLRWVDAGGEPILTGAERAEQLRRRLHRLRPPPQRTVTPIFRPLDQIRPQRIPLDIPADDQEVVVVTPARETATGSLSQG
jgi:hypothetical protein